MNIKIMRRGEVWLYSADPTVGDEIGKTRPAIIVSNNDLGTLRLKIVVPITGWQEVFEQVGWMVPIEPTQTNGLTKQSAADTFQIRSVSQQRLVKRIGTLSEIKMELISEALALVLKIHTQDSG
jgi:mRNA interferase MazF